MNIFTCLAAISQVIFPNDKCLGHFDAQLKIRIPGTGHHLFQDIVLFLNGLPVVAIECPLTIQLFNHSIH